MTLGFFFKKCPRTRVIYRELRNITGVNEVIGGYQQRNGPLVVEQPETRASLIVQLKDQRNASAWMDFVAAYEPFLVQLVRRQGTPQRHVADVTQQLLLAIVRSLDGWTDDGRPASFRRWLGRVARNVSIKFLLQERRHISGQGGSDLVQQLDQVADTSIDQADNNRYDHELIVWAAQQVKSEFKESSWKAFWATTVEGRSVADVATELNLSIGSIYMSRGRIVARIREKIDQVM